MSNQIDSYPRDYKQLYHETLTLCENRERDIEILQAQNAKLKRELRSIKDKVQEIVDKLRLNCL